MRGEHLIELLRKHLPGGAPSVILEVGAADGEDTARYAVAFPFAFIHAFEPLRRNRARLVRAIEAVDATLRVALHTEALSDVNGVMDFWESTGAPPERSEEYPWRYSSSLLPPKEHLRMYPWCRFTKTLANVARFDSLPLRIAAVDFIHIDVQGAELAVLRGMGAAFASVRAVWMEVSNIELYEGQPLRPAVEEFMKAAGFRLLVDTTRTMSFVGDQLWLR